ncbi:hypothetical protein HanXRQr2_Chr09g0372161 [Helianthus annuus]|uniref:Uncharacterized protein n=1 Tax=Helianthus annuus TaxID=4232 RepID=A0A9K3N7B7_HELAN|nr:hypothetical protein HanXRQr2_Chr09g0372161 [Helianthus annuus]
MLMIWHCLCCPASFLASGSAGYTMTADDAMKVILILVRLLFAYYIFLVLCFRLMKILTHELALNW